MKYIHLIKVHTFFHFYYMVRLYVCLHMDARLCVLSVCLHMYKRAGGLNQKNKNKQACRQNSR